MVAELTSQVELLSQAQHLRDDLTLSSHPGDEQ